MMRHWGVSKYSIRHLDYLGEGDFRGMGLAEANTSMTRFVWDCQELPQDEIILM